MVVVEEDDDDDEEELLSPPPVRGVSPIFLDSNQIGRAQAPTQKGKSALPPQSGEVDVGD